MVLNGGKKLETIASITGALALTGLAGQVVCSKMYREGIVEKMYSESSQVKSTGYLEALPYQVGWIGMTIPISLMGAIIGAEIGRTMKKTYTKVRNIFNQSSC